MRGFFPGRFQPFHRGHKQFVDQITNDFEEVVVGIGSAQASHTGRNPFTAGERVNMIHETLEDFDATTYVLPIEDIERYSLWPAHVQSLAPEFHVVYTNNPLVRRVCREADLEVRGVEHVDRGRFRGTEIRRRMVEDEPWRELVPRATIDVIEAIDGVGRLKRIVEHDQHAVDDSP